LDILKREEIDRTREKARKAEDNRKQQEAEKKKQEERKKFEEKIAVEKQEEKKPAENIKLADDKFVGRDEKKPAETIKSDDGKLVVPDEKKEMKKQADNKLNEKPKQKKNIYEIDEDVLPPDDQSIGHDEINPVKKAKKTKVSIIFCEINSCRERRQSSDPIKRRRKEIR
jgi:archaellum component FlaD/FlaE